MPSLTERIAGGEALLADGAMGTMLQARGLEPGGCPEALNLDRPELLEEIARLYREAGADLLLTNTFGGSPLKLASYGLAERCEEVHGAAIRAARAGGGAGALVALSCGPCGQLLRPYGEADPGVVAEGFRRQVTTAAGEGVDLVFVETMIDLEEALLALRASKEAAPGLPVSVTMTFDETPRGFFTIMGTSVERAADALGEAGADLVGSNCGHGIEGMVRVAGEFARSTSLPLVIQSNAGLPETRGAEIVYPETPGIMAARIPALLEAGVRVVGGCCGTTPEHIAAFRRALDSRP
jgi:5-methyltetrahydrofolate--homocysteine methyltransferase